MTIAKSKVMIAFAVNITQMKKIVESFDETYS